MKSEEELEERRAIDRKKRVLKFELWDAKKEAMNWVKRSIAKLEPASKANEVRDMVDSIGRIMKLMGEEGDAVFRNRTSPAKRQEHLSTDMVVLGEKLGLKLDRALFNSVAEVQPVLPGDKEGVEDDSGDDL